MQPLSEFEEAMSSILAAAEHEEEVCGDPATEVRPEDEQIWENWLQMNPLVNRFIPRTEAETRRVTELMELEERENRRFLDPLGHAIKLVTQLRDNPERGIPTGIELRPRSENAFDRLVYGTFAPKHDVYVRSPFTNVLAPYRFAGARAAPVKSAAPYQGNGAAVPASTVADPNVNNGGNNYDKDKTSSVAGRHAGVHDGLTTEEAQRMSRFRSVMAFRSQAMKSLDDLAQELCRAWAEKLRFRRTTKPEDDKVAPAGEWWRYEADGEKYIIPAAPITVAFMRSMRGYLTNKDCSFPDPPDTPNADWPDLKIILEDSRQKEALMACQK